MLKPKRKIFSEEDVQKFLRTINKIKGEKIEQMQNKYFQATRAHFLSKKLEAEAVLDTYFNNSVGIGEHSDIIETMIKEIEQVAKWEEILMAIDNNFAYSSQAKTQLNEDN